MLRDEATVLTAARRMQRMTDGLPWLRRVRSAADIRDAHVAGGHALWGMCQMNSLRPGDLDLIDAGKELGVVHTAECAYNQSNFIGGGCSDRHDPGLSYFGLEFVQRCNAVSVIVDTSHSSRQTTLDACEASTSPVIASHTSARALYVHDRAKTDEELVAIARTGGVIGAIAVPFFLSDSPERSVDLVLDHIDYIGKLVGWDHVGIGSDWPLQPPVDIQRATVGTLLKGMGFRVEHRLDFGATLRGFSDYRDMVNITRGLVGRGYPEERIVAVLGGNFMRVFEQVVG
jgi:membrane dipeptidase